MTELLGECPVFTAMEYDGLNDGIGAGRACWMVPNAFCHKDSVWRSQTHSCLDCEFYHRVVFEEENARFVFTDTHI